MICKYNSSVFICKKKKEKEKSIALAYLVGSLPGFKRSWDHGHSCGLKGVIKQEAWFGVTLGVSIYYNVFLSILLNIISLQLSAVSCTPVSEEEKREITVTVNDSSLQPHDWYLAIPFCTEILWKVAPIKY